MGLRSMGYGLGIRVLISGYKVSCLLGIWLIVQGLMDVMFIWFMV
jgi:hypothetical protein